MMKRGTSENRFDEFEVFLKGRRLKNMHHRIFESLRKEYDLKQVEIEVLVYLFAHPEGTAKQIARDLQLHKGHVSLATERLCEKGMIRCVKDPEDRRRVNHTVTERGEAVFHEVCRKRESLDQRLFGGFSEAEREQFSQLTRRIMDNIDSMSETE